MIETTHEVLDNGFGREYGEYLPTAIVQIVEAIDPEDGKPVLIHVRPSDTSAWKAIGMLDFARRVFMADALEDD